MPPGQKTQPFRDFREPFDGKIRNPGYTHGEGSVMFFRLASFSVHLHLRLNMDIESRTVKPNKNERIERMLVEITCVSEP